MNEPLKYRKRPVVIEAMQLTETNAAEVKRWIESFYSEPVVMRGGPGGGSKGATLIIRTLEGNHLASVGDQVIRGVSDEAYPCKPDIFAATYEAEEPTMSEPLSAERLAEIRARAYAATMGPWYFAYTSIWGEGRVAREEAWLDSLDAAHTLDRNPCEHCSGGPCAYRAKALDMDPVVARVQPSYGDTATGQRVLDAEFIAHARQDVPDLLAEIDRLAAENAAALTLAREWRDQATDYDEDTEQQIQDGYEIARALGDPCPHAHRATIDFDVIEGRIVHKALTESEHRCWICGQVGNLDTRPGERLPSHDDAGDGHDATPADERGRASAFRHGEKETQA